MLVALVSLQFLTEHPEVRKLLVRDRSIISFSEAVRIPVTVEVADVPGAIWVSFAVDHRAFATVASVDREFRLCQSRLAWKCQRKVRDKVSGKVKFKGQRHDYHFL